MRFFFTVYVLFAKSDARIRRAARESLLVDLHGIG